MIKPYSRKLVKVKEEIHKKEVEQEQAPISEGGSIRKYEPRGTITDIKPTRRPLKIKEMEPTSTRDRLDYFIKFDFFK